MRYQNYKNKMLKIRKVIDAVYHLRFVIIGVAVVTAASITTLDLTKGNITEVSTFQKHYTYGDPFTYSGDAFMSNVTFEFRCKNKQGVWSDWSEDQPYLPGEYEVRARSQGNHGYKYSDVSGFFIDAYPININIASGQLAYGNDHPELIYDNFLPGDHLENDYEVVYADKYSLTTTANINMNSLHVLNKDGVEVTDCYEFITEKDKEIQFSKADVTVTFEAEKKYPYSGDSYSNDEYIFTGPKYYGAEEVVTGGETAIETGTYNNTHEVKMMVGEKDVSECYNITTVNANNSFEIEKADEIVISSESLTKVYDGEPFEATHFDSVNDLTLSHELLPGHRLKLVGFTHANQKDVCDGNTVKNDFDFEIIDADENVIDWTTIYKNIKKEPGSIDIFQRPITITTGSVNTSFNNEEHWNTDVTYTLYSKENNEGLLTNLGHYIDVDKEPGHYQSIKGPASGVVNNLSYHIKDSEGNVVDDNYNINPLTGRITITKEPLTFKFTAQTVQYDGNEHPYYVSSRGDNAAELVEGTLPIGWTYDVHINKKMKHAYSNSAGYTANKNDVTYHIYDENSDEVLNIYTMDDFNFEFGTSFVTPKPLSITLHDFEKPFDGKTLAESIILEPNAPGSSVTCEGLVGSDRLEVNYKQGDTTSSNKFIPNPATDPSYTLAIEYAVYDESNNPIPNDYDPTFTDENAINATITQKSSITIETGDVSKTYNGTNNFEPNILDHNGTLGEEITINPNSTFTVDSPDVGTYPSYSLSADDLIIKIGDRVVNDHYQIINIVKSGSVTINQRQLYITPNENSTSGSHIYYDEKPHGVFANMDGTRSSDMYVPSGQVTDNYGLLPGHKIVMSNPQTITDPGTLTLEDNNITDKFGTKIYDAQNNDVTGNYYIYFSNFYIEIVKNTIEISPIGQSKVYDGQPFEVDAAKNLAYDTFYDIDSKEMKQLYNVVEHAFAPGETALQPGHKLQVTKYSHETSNGNIKAGGYDIYPYTFEYRVIDTNYDPAVDVTSQYQIDAHQDYYPFYVDYARLRVMVNTGGSEYNSENCQPPAQNKFELGYNASYAYLSNSYSSINNNITSTNNTSFFNRYSIRCLFDYGSNDPNNIWRVGTYNFGATFFIYDKQTSTEYAYDAIDDIIISWNKDYYAYTFTKRKLDLTVESYSSGKERRSIGGSGLAGDDIMVFGPEGVNEELIDGSREFYDYDADTYRILRDGVDVTSCYDVRIIRD